MVVCKFFLQGTCKFGEMCKFDHDINDNFNAYQNTGGTSILRNSTLFGATPITQPKINPVLGQEKSNVDTATLVKSVVADMTQAEKGGQWLFSCYAPFKEKPAFPGFEDQSFEELRFGYYEAAKGGTVEQFKQQIQAMVQQVLMKVRSLQNPSPDIVNMLVGIYNTSASPQAGIFSGNSNTSNFSFKSGAISQQPVFAQANQNVFANTQQQQNIFSPPTGSTNIFASNNQRAQNNIFSSSNQVPQNNMFANQVNNAFQSATSQVPAASNNIFTQGSGNLAVQNSNSIFSAQPPSTASIFASTQQPPNASIFAPQSQPNTLFQPVSQASSIFGVPNLQQPQTSLVNPSANIFNTPMQTPPQAQITPMQNPPQVQTIQPQQNSLFNQPPPPSYSNSMMAAPKIEIPQPQAYSNSIFSSQQNNSAPFLPNVQPPQFDESIYSKLEDLTEEEIKWFESDDLDVMKIPAKPPTYQMCFKS